MHLKKYWLLATLTIVALKSISQTVTDVSDKVSNILFAYGKVNVTRNTTTRVLVPGGERIGEHGQGGGAAHWETKIIPVTTQEYLQATGIRTIRVSNPEFGQDSIISLPDKFIESSQNFINTSTVNSSQSETFSLAFARSSSIAFAHSISHTSSFTASFQVKITDAFSLGGNVQVGENETNGTTSTTTDQVTVTRSSTVQVDLAPKTAVRASFRVWTVRHNIKFKCLVTIDADISQNDAAIKLLSQIADEPSRTFEINGIITANDCTDGETTQSDPVPLNKEQLKNLSNSTSLKFE